MKTLRSTLAALTMGFIGFGAISISADESEERNVMVQIHKLSDSNTKVDLDVNGHAEVFNLPDLEVGETKDIVTESGSTISVTKTESGISVSIDGEEINLPSVGGDMAAHFMKGGMPLHTDTSDGVQVIGDLTEEQIAIIKDAFAAAGVDKEVKFSKGHQMRFITIDGNSGKDVTINGKDLSFEFHTDSSHTWTSADDENTKAINVIRKHDKLNENENVFIIKKKIEKKD